MALVQQISQQWAGVQQLPGSGSPEWNRAIISAISYTCALSVCQSALEKKVIQCDEFSFCFSIFSFCFWFWLFMILEELDQHFGLLHLSLFSKRILWAHETSNSVCHNNNNCCTRRTTAFSLYLVYSNYFL